MRKFILSFTLIAITVFLAYGYYFNYITKEGYDNTTFIESRSNMTIISPVFSNGNSIPAKYTCEGVNINPPLNISTVSIFAKSLALIVEDPDSPSKDFTHWILFNIKPEITSIDENSIPNESIEGMNDFEEPHYAGPCPSKGEHRYVFKLYSLDTFLNLEKGATKQQVLDAMKGHILEQTKLTGKYKLSG
ncbi:MAG: YbhB/YbcL family Raf kinase inhibitor-like protein [Patescibacteria group bacterium]